MSENVLREIQQKLLLDYNRHYNEMKIDEMSRWEGQLLKIRLFLAALRASETDTLDRLEYSVINITKEYGYRV